MQLLLENTREQSLGHDAGIIPIIPIPIPKTGQTRYNRPIPFMNIETKTLGKALADRIQQHKKEFYILTKCNLFQGCKAGSTSENQYVEPTILKAKERDNTSISINTETHMSKSVFIQESKSKGNFLNFIPKCIGSIFCNGLKLNTFPQRQGEKIHTRQSYAKSSSSWYQQTIKVTKGIQMKKEEINVCLFEMIRYSVKEIAKNEQKSLQN
jgi:hypothetical protein